MHEHSLLKLASNPPRPSGTRLASVTTTSYSSGVVIAGTARRERVFDEVVIQDCAAASVAVLNRSGMRVKRECFRSGLSYDPNIRVGVYVPGFGVDSSGYACFETEGAGGEIAKGAAQPGPGADSVLTGADVA